MSFNVKLIILIAISSKLKMGYVLFFQRLSMSLNLMKLPSDCNVYTLNLNLSLQDFNSFEIRISASEYQDI